MDFYLTDISSGTRLRFPLLPDRLNVRTGALAVSLTIIKTGEVKIPRGTSLTGYSWNGTLPGQSMKDASGVFDWQEPQRIISLLEYWQNGGNTLRFMATEISVNMDVFIESFNYEYFGADNVSYSIALTVRRQLAISTTTSQSSVPNTTASSPGSSPNLTNAYGTVKISNTGSYLNVRRKASTGSESIGRLNHNARIQILEKSGNWYIIPWSGGTNGKAYVYASYVVLDSQTTTSGGTSGSSGSSSSGSTQNTGSSRGSSGSGSYTVKSGDSLYSIAKSKLGNGSRYTEIYSLNKSAIDARNAGKSVSKYTIYAGQILKLPSN